MDTPIESAESISLPTNTSAAAGPRKYMSKRQSACDACRARKSACQIEHSPPCRLCVAHSKPCTFKGLKVARRPPKSKAEQSQSVSTGPSAFEDSISNNLNLQTSSWQESSAPSNRDERSPSHPIFQDAEWNDLFSSGLGLLERDVILPPIDPSMASGYQPGAVFDDVTMDGLNGASFEYIFCASPYTQTQERSLDNLPSMAAELCGLTGDMDPYVLRRYRYNDNGEFEFSKLSIRSTQDEAMPVQFLLSPAELSSASRAETELGGGLWTTNSDRDRLCDLIPVEIGKRLIQLFFRFVCPQFPILSDAAPPDPEIAPVHLLAAIYCVAQPFAIYDDRLCIDFAYKPPSTESLFNISWVSLNRALHVPTIASVQSGLILLLRPPVNELILDSGFKWALLGAVVSMSQSIGLHLDPSSWRLPRDELLLRKRVSWSVFAFDKWLALSFGRPSHINKLDWLIVQVEAADLGDEEGNSRPEMSICLQLSDLTIILDQVLTELYSIRKVSSLTSDYKASLQASQPLLMLLTDWYQNLGSPIHNITAENLSGDPDPRFSIHLCYHAVKITLLRALLRPFYRSGAAPPSDPKARTEWASAKHHFSCRKRGDPGIMNTSPEVAKALADTLSKQSRLGAKMCANAAVKLISSFRASHYQAFWAPWYKTHLAVITNLLCLLAITSPAEDFPASLSALNQARAIFRVQARSCPMIQFALLRIDAIFWVGFDTVIDNRNNESEQV